MAQTNKSKAHQSAMRERAENGDMVAMKALTSAAKDTMQKRLKRAERSAAAFWEEQDRRDYERTLIIRGQEEDEAFRMNMAVHAASDYDAIAGLDGATKMQNLDAAMRADAYCADVPSDLHAAIGLGRIAMVMFIIVAVVSLYLGFR